jgi:AraC-like DNA-binding protein
VTFFGIEGFISMMSRSQFTKLFFKSLRKNISNPDLNGAMIAEDLEISRMHLHRHLRRHFNKSAREIITTTRLQLARKLLLSKHLTISKIASLTGYSDPAYFSRIFRQTYGLSPSAFRSSKEE